MSLKSIIANSECKDFKNRSNKLCCCGCHSKKDVKKNLHHHSTFMKESHKKNRELKYFIKGMQSENITWGFLPDMPEWY